MSVKIPVGLWRFGMALTTPREARRFNAEPVAGVTITPDLPYTDAIDPSGEHHLDVCAPEGVATSLPVYVYLHGGGWNSGDKAQSRAYCAHQAAAGAIVVNANYRLARPGVHFGDMLDDVYRVLDWTERHISEWGGDPSRVILGGDSAGAQLSSLAVSARSHPELAGYWGVTPSAQLDAVIGVVQHCSAADMRHLLSPASPMSRGFVRQLLKSRDDHRHVDHLARYLSPVAWIDDRFPSTFVSTSERDFLYQANLSYLHALRGFGVRVRHLVLPKSVRSARHTWQQDPTNPASAGVFTAVTSFIAEVSAAALPAATGVIGGTRTAS